MKIAVCPGHHELAKGAVNLKYGLNEHDEARKVVFHLLERLANRGHSVHLFKGKLSKKISAINKGNFDLALDIHFNAGGGHGCEVLHYPSSSKRKEQASEMSRIIATYLGITNRGGKEGWYWGGTAPGTKPDAFLAQTNCMAFIPEPLFIDNDNEAYKFLVQGRHDQIAEAICMAVDEVLNGAG